MILAISINDIWPAGVMMVILAAAFALILLVASIKLRVEIDPKIEQVQAALPGVDCGACGMAGCASYAKAVVADPELLGKCAPGGADVSAAIAKILNLQASGSGAPIRPVIHCHAKVEDRTYYAGYTGIPSCTAANAQANVMACKFGCLGMGDCVSACKFDALHIVDGIATVDYEKCTGCMACSKACPRNLIEMVPFTQEKMMVVACASRESGKDTKSFCKVGCIGCKMCTKQSDNFQMAATTLAHTDYESYVPSEQNDTAMAKCPTGAIVYRGKNA